jgi:SecD/SecF fusion protein
MVLVLFIMGVSSIREFAAPLMVGILVGGYSSVCITGALWFVMKTRLGKKVAEIAGKNAKTAPAAASASKNTTAAPAPKSNEPKKKNRKRVAQRLAAQEAAKLEEEAEDQEEE